MFLSFAFLFLSILVPASAGNDPACGTKGPPPLGPNDELARIIHGQETSPHEFPWMCLLESISPANYAPFCGAFILNRQWILTAAHCAAKGQENVISILCGVHNWKNLSGNESRRSVAKIIRHPGYSNRNFVNDLSLIKLVEDLDLDNPAAHLGSVCLPDSEEIDRLADSECIATGWGMTQEDSEEAPRTASSVLRKGRMRLWKEDDCRKVLSPWNLTTEGVLCAGDGNANQSCIYYGDSGGPLNCFDGKRNRWMSYGIASFGIGAPDGSDNCANGMPRMFARISSYSQWIWKTIEAN